MWHQSRCIYCDRPKSFFVRITLAACSCYLWQRHVCAKEHIVRIGRVVWLSLKPVTPALMDREGSERSDVAEVNCKSVTARQLGDSETM